MNKKRTGFLYDGSLETLSNYFDAPLLRMNAGVFGIAEKEIRRPPSSNNLPPHFTSGMDFQNQGYHCGQTLRQHAGSSLPFSLGHSVVVGLARSPSTGRKSGGLIGGGRVAEGLVDLLAEA